MDLERVDEGKVVRLRIRGELNALTAPDLRESLALLSSESPEMVILDLSQLNLIDCSGVGVIVSLFKRLRRRRGDLRIRGLRGQPQSIFHLLHLDRVFVEK